MEVAGFTFTIGELDGCRLIESVFPHSIDKSRVWTVASSYPTLWDESRPTVTMNDVTQLGPLSDEARGVLKWVLQQNMRRATLVATSWVTGGDEQVRERICSVLTEVGRPTETVFATREEAIEYLRERIRASRDAE